MEKTARTKLSERNMHWEETYTERTISFKEMYEDIIGEGSYYRWEGKDIDSGDEYFVVLSPANMKKPKARWFTGCRKLPSDWAAGGKYFSEIKEAMDYANETWGVPVPSNFKWGYDSSDLKGIGDKMDDWREETSVEAKGIANISKVSKLCDFPLFYRESGAKEWISREGYTWFSADQVVGSNPIQIGDSDPKFNKMAEDNPKLLVAKENIFDERKYRRKQLMHRYGEQYATPDFYQSFLGIGPEGIFIVVVSPYLGKQYEHYGAAKDKLGVFRKKLNILNKKEIDAVTKNFIAKYLHEWGVQLLPEDVSAKGTSKSECSWGLSKSGLKKAKAGKIYQDNLNYYKTKYPDKVKTQKDANIYFQQEMEDYRAKEEAYDIAYAEAQASGKALEFNMPKPPPSLNFKKPLKKGSQRYTAVYKEEEKIPKGMNEEQKVLKYGFNSFQDALAYTISTMSSDFPAQQISSINITFDDLKAAREKNDATKTPEQKIQEQLEEDSMLDNIKKKQEALLEEMHSQDATEEALEKDPLKDIDMEDEDEKDDEVEEEISPMTINTAPEKEKVVKPKSKKPLATPPSGVTLPESMPKSVPGSINIPGAKIHNVPKQTPKTEEPLETETFSVATIPSKNVGKKPKKTIEDFQKELLEREKKKVVTNTMLNLVKLAEALDNENKPEDAEEIHRILRKHAGNQHD